MSIEDLEDWSCCCFSSITNINIRPKSFQTTPNNCYESGLGTIPSRMRQGSEFLYSRLPQRRSEDLPPQILVRIPEDLIDTYKTHTEEANKAANEEVVKMLKKLKVTNGSLF